MTGLAHSTLERLLAIARRNGASEVRLISGRRPVIVVADRVRYLSEPEGYTDLERYFGEAELTGSRIRDIHLACLTMAAAEIPATDATLAYHMVSKTFGVIRCEYTLSREARTLLLIPDGDAAESVLVSGHRNLPPLRAAAEVDPVRRTKKAAMRKPNS